MRYPIIQFCLLACTIQPALAQDSPVTLFSELQNFASIAQLPRYRPRTIEAQVSTWDRTGGNDDGFNGTYSFVRKNPDGTLVIFDQDGPGVINRIWTPTPTRDTLDFFIDGASTPQLSVCYQELFTGKTFPFVGPLCGYGAGGWYCYFPILFQQHCTIVCRAKKTQFHQIQYRLFPADTHVTSFTGQLSAEEKTQLSNIARLWSKPDKTAADFSSGATPEKNAQNIDLAAGQAATVFQTMNGGRITGILIKTPEAIDSNIRIEINWDGDPQPAIDCPLAAFFGYCFGKPSMQSLLLGERAGMHYCYFPMPFDRSATIRLVNGPAKSFQANIEIDHTDQQRDEAHEGRLYAAWHDNELSAQAPFHTFLETRTRGHYVGTILLAQGFTPGSTPFFEGDDSTAIDGQLRIHGTGSEDYFNGGWYDLRGRWDRPRSFALSGCLCYEKKLSRTGGYRFYLNDKLSFEESIYQGIEHGRSSAQAEHVRYRSVAFFYAEHR